MTVAPLRQLVISQLGAELRLTLRRGENLLITFIVPIALLVFFSSLAVVRSGTGRPIDFLLPGMLALAIIATGTVSLGIATAYERYYGVLKRLGASPLPRGGLICAKSISVLLVECVQVLLLGAIAVVGYEWRPIGIATALGILVLGSLCFAGLGLAMAGALRAETTLAGANALYLVFLLTSGAVLPLSHLPHVLEVVARLLPAAAFTDALRASLTMGQPVNAQNIVVLVVWTCLFLAIAARTFRWE